MGEVIGAPLDPDGLLLARLFVLFDLAEHVGHLPHVLGHGVLDPGDAALAQLVDVPPGIESLGAVDGDDAGVLLIEAPRCRALLAAPVVGAPDAPGEALSEGPGRMRIGQGVDHAVADVVGLHEAVQVAEGRVGHGLVVNPDGEHDVAVGLLDDDVQAVALVDAHDAAFARGRLAPLAGHCEEIGFGEPALGAQVGEAQLAVEELTGELGRAGGGSAGPLMSSALV